MLQRTLKTNFIVRKIWDQAIALNFNFFFQNASTINAL